MRVKLLSLFSMILLVSLILAFTVQPVFAAPINVTIVKTGLLTLDHEGLCYEYVIHFQYTITNGGSGQVTVDSIVDPGVTVTLPIVKTIEGNFGHAPGTPNHFLIADGYYKATDNVTQGIDQISTSATVTVHDSSESKTVTSLPYTVYLPKYSTPDAWYLNYKNLGGTTTSPLEMKWVKEGDDRNQGDGVFLGYNGTMTWLSDKAAGSDTTYPSNQDWTLLVHTPKNWITQPEVTVGEWDGSQIVGDVATIKSWTWDNIPGAPTSPPGPYPNFTHTIILQSSSQIVVHTGHYLALQIKNKAQGDNVVVTCNKVGGTYLQPPAGTTGQVLPEMPAGILFGVGLAGIGGFVLIKRRSKVSSAK
jgi:hypothetical protein